MKKVFYISFFVCFYLSLSAQNTLKTKFIKPTSDLKPGSYFSIFFEVRPNRTVFSDSISVDFELPKSWKLLTKKLPTSIIGQSEVRYMFTLSSQSNTKSGSYPIIAKTLNLNNNVLSVDTCKVTIQKYRKLDIIALNFPESAKEGDTLRVKYLLQNLGNNQEKVRVKVEEGTFENLKDTLSLDSKESIELNYKLIIPIKAQNYWVLNPFIKIIPVDTTVALGSIFQSLPVYSTTLKKTDLYLRLPVDVGLWYNSYTLGNRKLGGFQFDVRGKGFLDFDSKHFIDFVLHGPNNFEIPIIGSYDIYSLQYKYKKTTQITAGDYTLRFNNLMEFGRFGRGLMVEQNINKSRLTAFMSVPRFSQNEKFEAGGSFQTPLNKNLGLSFNYMFKKVMFYERNEINTNLIGVSTNYLKSNLRIDTELATGVYKSKLDIGFYNQLTYQGNRIYFNNISIYTGKDFYGFYNNSIAFINSLGFKISKALNFTINNNFNRLNPSFDLTNFNTSPLSNTYSAFLGIRLDKSNHISLGYNILEREDRFEPKTFHYKDNFGSFNYIHNSKRVRLSLISRYGSTLNRLVTKDENYKNEFIANSFDSEIKILKWLSIGALLDQQRTSKFSLNNEVRDLYYYGGRVGLNINKFLIASFSYRSGYAPDELTTVTNNLSASVELNFKNHSLGAMGGKTMFPNIPNLNLSNQNLTFFNVRYTYRLNAPIAKRKNLGNIRGQLLGFENSKKDGIIIQLGERRFMTDTSGAFYFNNLLPDTYIVSLDKTTIQKGLIPMSKLPLKIEVKPDSTKSVKISMTKTGSIEGKIDFIKGNNISNEYKEKPIVIVKLTNDKETFYTQLNKNDMFSFKEMKPQNWKLTAYFPNVEDRFTIINGEQSVLIQIDSTKFVNMQVKPVERKIYFSSNNFNLVTKKEEPKKEEKKKDEVKVEPISKLKTKSDSLNATSDIKKIKQEGNKKPDKMVQNTRKTFDKISVLTIRNKRRLVPVSALKTNIWAALSNKIAIQKSFPSISENPISIDTGQYIQPNTGEINSSDIEPNRELKNREEDKK